MMTRHLCIIFCFLLTVGLASCQKDDDTTVPVSDECYINSVTLGDLTRTIPVTDPEGNETFVTNTYNGAYYRMSINQLPPEPGKPCIITNPEPLLYRTVLGPTMVNVVASGTVLYRPVGQLAEAWTAYTSSLPIDISTDIIFRVVATDGIHSRDYRMTINVRKEDPLAFEWDSLEVAAPFEGYTRLKTLFTDDGVVAMASHIGGVRSWISRDTLQTWSLTNIADNTEALGRADVETLTLWNGKLWMSTSDSLLLNGNTDNTCWQVVGGAPNLRIVTGGDSLYAISADRQMWAMGEDGKWNKTASDEPDKLPVAEAIGVAYKMPSGDDRVLMVGKLKGDTATVWGRTLGVVTGPWIHYTLTHENRFPLPMMEGMSVACYNQELVAVGGNLEAAYISVDNGITWKPDYGWSLPEAIQKAEGPATLMPDDNGHLWLVRGRVVYRGHANTLK